MVVDASSMPLERVPKGWIAGVTALVLAAGAVGAAIQLASPGTEELVSRGEGLLAAGRADAAIEPATKAWQQSPSDPAALSLLGRVQLQLGRTVEAVASLERVPPGSSAFRQAQLLLAKALLLDGQWERAEDVLSAQVEAAPDDAAALEELRWLYFNLFRTRDVLRLLERRLAAGDLSALPDLLDSEYHGQAAHEASKYLDPVQARRPGQGLVMTALGICRWRTGLLDEGGQLLAQGLQKRPDDPHVRLMRAEFLLEQGNVDSAEEALIGSSEPVVEQPAGRFGRIVDHEEFWALRSRIAERRRNLKESLTLLDRALEINGARRDLLTRRASLLRLMGRTEDAAAAAMRAEAFGQAERLLRSAMERGLHRRPSRDDCLTLAALCRDVGKSAQADAWKRLATNDPGSHER
jgi:tetratricopeptide (TPR) repeat protein